MVRPARNEEPAPEERDLQFENIMGNYYVAQYQTSRLIDHFETKMKEAKPDPKTGKPKIKSSHTIKHNGKWYKITTTIREVGIDELLGKD